MCRRATFLAKGMSSLALLVVISTALSTIVAAPALAAGGKRHFNIVGFALNCKYATSLPDDPILLHGQPGASPGNDFYGATNVDANSTYESLRTSDSTCIMVSIAVGARNGGRPVSSSYRMAPRA